MSENTIICVTMRYKSHRLPGKAMIDLGGVNSIDLLAAQLQGSKHRLVICCTDSPDDDVIADYTHLKKIDCFRGSFSVVQRMVSVAKEFGVSYFAHVTGDDLFVDPVKLDLLVDAHKGADFTFSDLPKGTESHVINTSFADRLLDSYGTDTEYWDKKRSTAWKSANLNFVPLSPIQATSDTFSIELDTPVDAEFIKSLLGRLRANNIFPPYHIDDLISMHNIEPFLTTKDPIDRQYFTGAR